MQDTTKGLIGGIAACLTLFGIFALMADCSKTVAREGGQRAADCVANGGTWHSMQIAIDDNDNSFCQRKGS